MHCGTALAEDERQGQRFLEVVLLFVCVDGEAEGGSL